MKAVILAGGYGTRLAEETGVKPKPMVEIGGYPILWHIMKIFGRYGVNDFVICCGYKGHIIKEYFVGYHLRKADVTVDLSTNHLQYLSNDCEPWRVTLVDTGHDTMTGGRLKRVRNYVGDETFFLTYGDGVSDVDLDALVAFHKGQGTLATLTAVKPPGRFGSFLLHGGQNQISHFWEKSLVGDGHSWINGGFFVLEPGVMDYIDGDATAWEHDPLEQLASDGQLSAFRHEGFWHPMDTLNDRMILDRMWESGSAPWKTWQSVASPNTR